MKRKDYLRGLLTNMCVLLLPVLSYLILGPLEVYFGNTKNFTFSYLDFIVPFLILALLALVIGSVVLSLLPKKVKGIALALILGVGTASYIQNMFMNIKLSEVDGTPLDWSTLGNFPIINLLVWIAILAVILLVYLKLKKHRTTMLIGVSGFLSVIQVVAVVSLLFSGTSGSNTSNLQIHGDKQYMLGKQDNVVVFVLDTFGNTRMENLLSEDPEALKGFEDFTYYSNADCHYYTTFPSMTHLLTGMDFDFEANSPEWLRSAWKSDRAKQFYQNLHDKGYTCNYYSKPSYEVTGDTANLYNKFDNVQPTETQVDHTLLMKLMGKISIYRGLPYVLKPRFEVLTHAFGDVVSLVEVEDPTHDNAAFYSKLMEHRLSVDENMDKAFVIQHLFGVHAPYTTGSHGEAVKEATAAETAQGLLYMIRAYIDQMKALGIYDDATVIVTADHGSWGNGDTQPIFMIKMPNQTHEVMPVNGAPISLDDFQATIMSVVGYEDDMFGTSIFDWKEGDLRERTVYMRRTVDSMPKVPGSAFNAYFGYTYTTDKHELNAKVDKGPEIILSATPWHDIPPEEPELEEPKAEKSFSIVDIIGIPLSALMKVCHSLIQNHILTIVVFTMLTKLLLLPVSLWMQRSSIRMVEMMPELNRLKTKYFGDKETIAEETQLLYKKKKYNPITSTVPMIVQIVLLMGVIQAVKALLGDSNSWLLWIPVETGGLSLLMPVAAGFAALLLTLAQNKLAPLQREQHKAEQLSTGVVSVCISLFLGAFVSLGTGVYWIASNLFSIPVQLISNWIVNPKKYVDYEALEASRKELAKLESVGKKKKESFFSENRKRERADYKRFFSIVNKHLVFYSESNGFYKYYKGFIEYILAHTNIPIHYITSDPNDQIFELAKTQPQIKGYYIGENKLITLMMKMDADVVVMTMPDLENYHIKRSYIRNDIEYINVSHGMGSNNLAFRKGALDHFDAVFCAGIHQTTEIRQQEEVYGLPAKACVEVGYPLIDEMREAYAKTEHKENPRKKILIAPSWQRDNIVDSCLEELLDNLKNTDYEIIVRPHPQEVRLKQEYMDSLKAKYEPAGIEIQTDFSSNNPVLEADLLITDWSGISWEYAFTTLRPVMYINTPMKEMNPEWQKIEYPPLNITLRDKLGKSLDMDQLDKAAETAEYLLANTETYHEKINALAHEYLYNLGSSSEAGARYIIKVVLDKIKMKGSRKNEE